jgi:hypothetical protein
MLLAELDNTVKTHGSRHGQVIKQINVHIIELPPQANAPAAALFLACMHCFYAQDCVNPQFIAHRHLAAISVRQRLSCRWETPVW